jgi:two-component system chemotaxis response regulator CheB
VRDDFPVPIVIVQHISSGFEDGLALWLNSLTPLQVMVAQKGQQVQAGQVLIAPSGAHMQITPTGHVHLVADKDGYLNIPSVTVMMASLAESYGSRAMGVLLTGMGDDGAAGLRMIYDAGGHTIAQDEQSSVVFGMPREAIALGAARYVRPLDQIGRTINAFVMQRMAQASASV